MDSLKFSESWDTELPPFLPIFLIKTNKQTKKKLKLGKGLAKHLKIILPKTNKNRHVDHLFQEWFYTGVSQYKFGFILQDRIRSLAI